MEEAYFFIKEEKGGMDMKYLRWIALLTAAFLLTACAAKEEPPAFDETAFLEEIKPNVECLNQCELELFGAEVDVDTTYYGVYESEEAYDNGEGTVAKLYLPGEEEYPISRQMRKFATACGTTCQMPSLTKCSMTIFWNTKALFICGGGAEVTAL